jgi:hypothetical protein
MKMMYHARRSVVTVLLFAAAFASVGCNSRWFRRAARSAGTETAYATLTAALVSAKIVSADHMVDAVRMVVEKKDYGGAAAAFAVALNEHNLKSSEKLTSAQVIGYMRLAQPTVRKVSPRVGSGLTAFCDYVSKNK